MSSSPGCRWPRLLKLLAHVYLVGSLFGFPFLALVGVILLGHSSFDRVLGLSLIDPNAVDQHMPESIPLSRQI